MPSSSFSSRTVDPPSGDQRRSLPDHSKSREKEQLVGLNDRFVQLIDKVKGLEDEKKKLEKKLELLKKQDDYAVNIDDNLRREDNELEEKIDKLLRDKDKLKDDLDKITKEKDDHKKRYEDEIKNKTKVEDLFILAKKEVDEGHFALVADALDLEELSRELERLTPLFEEEIKELKSLVRNDKVVLRENNKRHLNMDDIVKEVNKKYADLAARAREEAELWNQRKMDDMVSSVAQGEQKLRDIKREISDTKRLIQRLKGDLDALKRKEDALKRDIDDARKDGDENMAKAQKDIKQLEDAMKKHKQDLAQQVLDHQKLLDLKLSLDIEIATYRKLLEGEERRMNERQFNADY
ncbi:intermediate filament protein ON3 [Nematolebias whitei]|uniref:intermediate filament protein ON3 n=1 Tax=Nematolebias whitei TaxID=451745 RepID=UPI001898051B|nr:intermediate filament protein ON3 [Nematolebias whitei]